MGNFTRSSFTSEFPLPIRHRVNDIHSKDGKLKDSIKAVTVCKTSLTQRNLRCFPLPTSSRMVQHDENYFIISLRGRQFYLSSDLLTFQSWGESSISSKLFFWLNIGVEVNKSFTNKLLLLWFSSLSLFTKYFMESNDGCNINKTDFNNCNA